MSCFNSSVRALAAGCAVAALMIASAAPVRAQAGPASRDRLVQKLTGKHIRIDAVTKTRRAITAQEATELVTALEAMTAGASIASTTVAPSGAKMATLDGHAGHVIVARPNADGTTSLRCVATVEEAVDFLSEEPPDVM